MGQTIRYDGKGPATLHSEGAWNVHAKESYLWGHCQNTSQSIRHWHRSRTNLCCDDACWSLAAFSNCYRGTCTEQCKERCSTHQCTVGISNCLHFMSFSYLYYKLLELQATEPCRVNMACDQCQGSCELRATSYSYSKQARWRGGGILKCVRGTICN